MSQAVAVFCADTHLADKAWSGRPIEGDAYYSFHQIVDLAIERKLQAVVGAGDLLDRVVNHSAPIVFLHGQLDKLEKARVSFKFIQGNHELTDTPWFASHRWAEHVDNAAFDLGDIKCFGLDYHPAGLLQIALATIPEGTHILVSHQAWSDFCGGEIATQGSSADIPGVPVNFTGDYHVCKRVEARGRDGQKITMISPGSTAMQAIDEDPAKYAMLLYDDFTWKKFRLKTRPKIEHDVLHPGDVDTFMQTIDGEIQAAMDATVGYDEKIRKPLLRITYPYRMAEERVRLEKTVAGRAHIFWKELPPDPAPEVVARRKTTGSRQSAATLESELVAYLRANNCPELEADCQRLLAAADVGAELRRLKEEEL